MTHTEKVVPIKKDCNQTKCSDRYIGPSGGHNLIGQFWNPQTKAQLPFIQSNPINHITKSPRVETQLFPDSRIFCVRFDPDPFSGTLHEVSQKM
jgi:hypothetical protein